MNHFDAVAAQQRYAEEETDDLVGIAYLRSDSYVPEAVALAKAELARRGIRSDQDEVAAASLRALAEEEQVRLRTANVPLGVGYKIVCFILADIVALVIAVTHYQSGKRRAAREAWMWMGYGWLLRIVIIALAVLSG